MTWVWGDTTILFAGAHSRVREKELDYEGKVTTAMIDYFYRGNEQIFKKTSSLHRESKAYVDLVTEEEQREEYPKFRKETNDQSVDEKHHLFPAEIWQEMQCQFKQQKHRMELAASLFSLRAALNNTKWSLMELDRWSVFTRQVEAQLERVKEEFIKQELSRKIMDCIC